ncbi:MAG: carboxylesterase family protein, partial [Streptosporangiaceae bacterium]
MQARWPGRRPGTMRRLRVAAVAAAAAALPLALVTPGPAQAGTAQAAARPGWGHGLVVPTDRGWVRGKHAEGISQWLGIPYAAPPVGALRWAA